MGAPFTPAHPIGRKIGYIATALALCLIGASTNGLLTNNLAYIAGGLGLTSPEANWLSIAYASMAAGANVLIVKARIQLGISRIFQWCVSIYALVALLAAWVPSFWVALLARAADGVINPMGLALAGFYLLEVLPVNKRQASSVIVIGLTQMAAPLARLAAVDVITADQDRGFFLIAFGVALLQLVMVLVWPLPPTLTGRVLRWRDLLTGALILPGLVLIVGVIGLGRVYWWTDTPCLGWMLMCAVPLLALGLLHEYLRDGPMLSLPWLSRADVLRFGVIALIERITLAEQSFGAVGLLSAAGLNNDQFHGLFSLVLLAEAAGIVTFVLTLSEKAIPYQVTAALGLIAVAGWIDSFSNGLTRMPQLLGTQALLGFGTTLFVGPALLYGNLRVARTGPQYLVTMLLVFNFTQNVGNLAGTALVSSYQYERQIAHTVVMADGLDATNQQATQRLTASGVAYASLDQEVTAQAALLGYQDAFRLITAIAAAALVVTLIVLIRRAWKENVDRGAPQHE